jgi:hypothetical protein
MKLSSVRQGNLHGKGFNLLCGIVVYELGRQLMGGDEFIFVKYPAYTSEGMCFYHSPGKLVTGTQLFCNYLATI